MNRTTIFIGSALLASAPALAQDATAPAQGGSAAQGSATAPATSDAASTGAPQVTVGSTVSDTSGGQVGTITAVANGTATIDTGTAKAAVPVTSLGKGPSGLVLAMTKSQLEAAVAAQTAPTQIAVGNSVVGPQGGAVGKVTAVGGDLVTVQTATTKVQLPTKAFAQKGPGTLVIGMTAAQLEAAAKAAAGPSGS